MQCQDYLETTTGMDRNRTVVDLAGLVVGVAPVQLRQRHTQRLRLQAEAVICCSGH